jgi:hypothetical protein
MAQKIYYDSVNNKEVIDVSGVKDEAKVKQEFGLDAGVQIIEIDETAGDTHYVDNGTLKKKTGAENAAEAQAAADAKQAAKDAKKNAVKTKLGLTDQDLEDLKEALS